MLRLVMWFALAKEMFNICDASKGRSQVCGAGIVFMHLSHCLVKSFSPNSCKAFGLGLRIYPCRKILSLRHREEANPSHNFKQSHSTDPGQDQLICSGPTDYEHENEYPLL